MMQTDRYTYRVHWSNEDNEYVATVAELPSLSWLADTPAAAIEGLLALTAEVVSEMEAAGETPPEPFTTRNFSGNFVVRLTPEAHRRLAIEAAEQDVSLNRLVSSRLAAV